LPGVGGLWGTGGSGDGLSPAYGSVPDRHRVTVARMIEPVRPRAWRIALTSAGLSLLIALLAGCDTGPPPPTPEQVRAQLKRLMPVSVQDRAGWAADIQAAFAALEIEASAQNLCSALAITEQESTFSANPAVPGLGKIARTEIEQRAGRYKIPAFAVRAALQMKSPNGDTWDTRIAAVRTEKELSDIFEEMISRVPMGKRLLARANPVHTGGPMQVSIAFAEAHAKERPYPYAVDGSIRHEVFTRRGGMYFGIAHLLGYPASYDKPLFRFADFNAGRYASRNAAFQNALSQMRGWQQNRRYRNGSGHPDRKTRHDARRDPSRVVRRASPQFRKQRSVRPCVPARRQAQRQAADARDAAAHPPAQP
jgi:Protein of unknown function (DUF1615)